jgi:hypothetical protein
VAALNIDIENPDWPRPLKLAVEKAFDSMISDDPNRVKPPEGAEIPLEDRITQAIEKAWEQSGKVKVQKTIERGGKAFTQTFWVTPEQAKQLGLKPIEIPHPTYEPARERGRPPTEEHVMELPHSVEPIKAPMEARELWKNASIMLIKTPEGAVYEGRIRDSAVIGGGALEGISSGKFSGLGLKAKKYVQGVISYKKHNTYLEVDGIATAPWNFPTSKDPRKVVGVGSRLMAELFDIALEDEKIEEVVLRAWSVAAKFYEKLGFRSSREMPSVYRIDRKGMKELLKKLEENE